MPKESLLSKIVRMKMLSVIEISGKDAATFLQGQLTCDVLAIPAHSAAFMATCDRKGRMIANGILYFDSENYYVLLPKTMVSILFSHLKKYSVFSKVSLSEKFLPEIIEKALNAINPELAQSSEEAFLEKQIQLGIVFLQPKTSNLFTPQMINWQKIGGVSFTKGCFLGQEIVARTEHLGQLKRHLRMIHLSCSENHEPGDILKNNQVEPFGIICTAKNLKETYLAVIQDKAIESHEALFCEHKNLAETLN